MPRSSLVLTTCCWLSILALLGCQSEPPPRPRVTKQVKRKPLLERAAVDSAKKAPSAPPTQANPQARREAPLRQPGVLGDLITRPDGQDLNFYAAGPKPVIDEAKVAAHGIRKLEGKHIAIYTDLKPSPEVDELPQAFDQAVPQWRAYFEVSEDKTTDWKLWGYIIQDKAKFRAAGLFPDDLPDFANGYQRGWELWLYEQPSAYYRRHLLLHEGTHAAMYHWLGGAGPPWYAEGMAELFGTHAWRDGKLTMLYMPKDKAEVPEWGRVRLLKDAYSAKRALMLHEVLRLSSDAHRNNEAYAWSWAAATFFNNHPRYGDEFRKLRHNTKDVTVDFTKDFLTHFQDDVLPMQTEWQLLVANNEYGYDVARNAIEVKPTQPLPASGATIELSAERGWQSTGYIVEADQHYKLSAEGRYQLAKEPKVWWCEPGGVTIRYHRGQPLGMLLAAVRNDARPATPDELLSPTPIGLGSDLVPKATGTLWLKINEHDAEWADNQGTLRVHVHANK